MNERLTTDDLRGMLPSEIVERFDDLRAKLAASESARAALVAALSEVVATADNSWSAYQFAHIERYRALLAEQPKAPAPATGEGE